MFRNRICKKQCLVFSHGSFLRWHCLGFTEQIFFELLWARHGSDSGTKSLQENTVSPVLKHVCQTHSCSLFPSYFGPLLLAPWSKQALAGDHSTFLGMKNVFRYLPLVHCWVLGTLSRGWTMGRQVFYKEGSSLPLMRGWTSWLLGLTLTLCGYFIKSKSGERSTATYVECFVLRPYWCSVQHCCYNESQKLFQILLMKSSNLLLS